MSKIHTFESSSPSLNSLKQKDISLASTNTVKVKKQKYNNVLHIEMISPEGKPEHVIDHFISEDTKIELPFRHSITDWTYTDTDKSTDDTCSPRSSLLSESLDFEEDTDQQTPLVTPSNSPLEDTKNIEINQKIRDLRTNAIMQVSRIHNLEVEIENNKRYMQNLQNYCLQNINHPKMLTSLDQKINLVSKTSVLQIRTTNSRINQLDTKVDKIASKIEGLEKQIKDLRESRSKDKMIDIRLSALECRATNLENQRSSIGSKIKAAIFNISMIMAGLYMSNFLFNNISYIPGY